MAIEIKKVRANWGVGAKWGVFKDGKLIARVEGHIPEKRRLGSSWFVYDPDGKRISDHFWTRREAVDWAKKNL